ncbi:MAG TPA: NYN domain-containing protein [Planctomycetaceae bacterium]|jgi:predicted RNA-binding protein with PIN domain|nr:NYN domain-containing protein [Planctomycetaceae bacterium]
MPARFLLIDGYNLLHAAGMARRDYGPGDLQRCRERLLRYLAQKLSAAEIARATVIFDARDPPPDRPAQQVFRNIKVLFANPGGDADVVIQEWLADHSAPKRVTLVSSDHVLQRAARRHRAEFIDSEAFVERLERRRDRSTSAGSGQREGDETKPSGGLSAAETAHWMKIFGELSAIADREANATGPVATGEIDNSPTSGKMEPARAKRGKRAKSKSNAKPGAQVSSDDVAYWLEVFGDIPEARDLARGRSLSQADLERWLAEFERGKD